VSGPGILSTGTMMKEEMNEKVMSDRGDKKEFYLNFDEMAAYHQQNEEEAAVTSEVRLISELHSVVIVVEYMALFLATFGVALSMVINEVKYLRPLSQEDENTLTMYVSLSSLMLAAIHIYRYQL
jgi:hypothetical protein